MPTPATVPGRLTALLKSIGIPLVLHSTADLTPTLLIAVLESLLRERLPLSDSARECRSRAGKTEAMKVFLGILGDDLLGIDLAFVDCRNLADGGEEETAAVADLILLAVVRGVFDRPVIEELLDQPHRGNSSPAEDKDQATEWSVYSERTLAPTPAAVQGPAAIVRHTGLIELVDDEAQMASTSIAPSWAHGPEVDDDEDDGTLLGDLGEVQADISRLLFERWQGLEVLTRLM